MKHIIECFSQLDDLETNFPYLLYPNPKPAMAWRKETQTILGTALGFKYQSKPPPMHVSLKWKRPTMPHDFVFDSEDEDACHHQMMHSKKINAVLRFDAMRYNLFCEKNTSYLSK